MLTLSRSKSDPMFATLLHWIAERESIRYRRSMGQPKPWTKDSILRKYRFCNVDRCHDTETKWIFDNYNKKHAGSPTLWFNLVIARLVNWSPALARIGYFDAWGEKENLRFCHAIARMQADGEKAYTGAYMIPAAADGRPKHQFIADDILDWLWDGRDVALELLGQPETTCAHWAAFLLNAKGLGDFLVNQIVTDYKYSSILARIGTEDWTSFVLAGPGTKRGLNRLLGRELTAPWKGDDASHALFRLRDRVVRANVIRPDIFDDLNNLSNCMCEFDKYVRVKNGEGKPRSKYDGG